MKAPLPPHKALIKIIKLVGYFIKHLQLANVSGGCGAGLGKIADLTGPLRNGFYQIGTRNIHIFAFSFSKQSQLQRYF